MKGTCASTGAYRAAGDTPGLASAWRSRYSPGVGCRKASVGCSTGRHPLTGRDESRRSLVAFGELCGVGDLAVTGYARRPVLIVLLGDPVRRARQGSGGVFFRVLVTLRRSRRTWRSGRRRTSAGG